MFTHASRIGVLGLAASAVFMGVSVAEAGLLSANSGGAIPAFTGTQAFVNSFSGFTVNATVDYAVFAPGAFGVAFPGQDPSSGTDYVYAYQITNSDTPDATAVSTFTVGLDGDEPLGAIGFYDPAALVDPTASAYVGSGPTSAAWDFTAPGVIPVNSESAILLFTSSAAPEWHASTVSGAWSSTHELPSPTPEPAALGLVALGMGLISLRRK